jgi:hypothetical protein
VQIDNLVISAQKKELDQQADTNRQVAEMDQTLALILEQLKKLEDAIRSVASGR